MLAVLARRTGGARFPLSSLNLVVHKAHLSEVSRWAAWWCGAGAAACQLGRGLGPHSSARDSHPLPMRRQRPARSVPLRWSQTSPL